MITLPQKSSYQQLLFLFFFICCGPIDTITAAENRIIHFPKDRSLGELYISDRGYPAEHFQIFGWESLGQAKGDITIPAGKSVWLEITKDAWQGKMTFKGLKADDIQKLSFFPDANDSVLEDILSLSGLQELFLWHTQILGTGLKHLEELKNLKLLNLSYTHVGDNELAFLVGLESLEHLNLGYTPVSNAGLIHISKIKTLKNIHLNRTSVNDDGLAHIKNLTSLRMLNLRENYITNEGLKQLANLTELEELDLNETEISGAGLVHLRRMKKLKKLSLFIFNTKVLDEELDHLRHLESLEYLQLPPLTDITDAGLESLSELKSLESLSILSDFITEKGVGTFAKLKSLEFLDIGGSNINNACMAKLAEFPALKELWIQHSTATNEGLAELKNLKSLTKLSIGYSDLITDEGLTFLRELPNLVEFQLHSLNLDRIDLSCLTGMTSLENLVLHLEIKDEDLAGLPELKNLKRLNLDSKEITDAGMRHIANLKSLESLWLHGSEITDAGLVHLQGLSSLTHLQCSGTKVTEQGLIKIKEKISALRWHLDRSSSSIQPHSLVGKSLLELQDFKLNLSIPESNEKNILVCFFDMEQRPSRNCLLQLSEMAPNLKAKDVVVVAVQASKVNEETLNEWMKKNNIQLPVGMVQGGEEKIRLAWGVQSLPWLILTDKERIVRAEGFGINELDEKITMLTKNK